MKAFYLEIHDGLVHSSQFFLLVGEPVGGHGHRPHQFSNRWRDLQLKALLTGRRTTFASISRRQLTESQQMGSIKYFV